MRAFTAVLQCAAEQQRLVRAPDQASLIEKFVHMQRPGRTEIVSARGRKQ